MRSIPIIAVTLGDPAGIGPEVCLKACQSCRSPGARLALFGDALLLGRVADCVHTALPPVAYSWGDAIAMLNGGAASVIYHIPSLGGSEVIPGTVAPTAGLASYHWITSAIDAAIAGQVDAIVTGPIHKEALRAAGIAYPGHTEIFASRTGSERTCMMLTSPELTCSFVTTHVGYRDVPSLLSVQRVVDVIELSHEAVQKMDEYEEYDGHGRTEDAGRGDNPVSRGRRDPRLAICGLNPHAGEGGLFGGGEEELFIIPAVQIARQRGIQIVGPLPPDTAFLPKRRRETDCVICMYHDQGHIPLKTLAFDRAVNTTLGLPIIRTSVDHGTAFDIAWRGVADSSSMIEAISLASKLARHRRGANDRLRECQMAPSPAGGAI